MLSMKLDDARTKLVFAFFIIYVVWGSTYLGIRFAEESFPPFMLSTIRYLTAGLLMLGYLLVNKKNVRATFAQWRSAAILGALLMAGGNGGIVLAEQTVPSGFVSLVISVIPIFVVLIAWAGPEKKAPSLPVSLGLALGLAGIVMLIGPDEIMKGSGASFFGGLLVLGSALTWSIGSVYTKKLDLPKDPTLSSAIQMICGGTFMGFISVCRNEWQHFNPVALTWQSEAALLYLIVFGSIVAFSAYNWLILNVSAQQVATYAYVNPVVAVFLGWALAGEKVGVETMFAAVMIISAVALITTQQGRQAPLLSKNKTGLKKLQRIA